MLFHFTTMESNRAQIESTPARTTTKTCLHCQAAALLCRLYIPFVRASFEGERESIRKLKSLTKPGDDETDDSGNTMTCAGYNKVEGQAVDNVFIYTRGVSVEIAIVWLFCANMGMGFLVGRADFLRPFEARRIFLTPRIFAPRGQINVSFALRIPDAYL